MLLNVQSVFSRNSNFHANMPHSYCVMCGLEPSEVKGGVIRAAVEEVMISVAVK